MCGAGGEGGRGLSEVVRFLAEVESGTKRVDPDLRRAALDELQAHLDASVQARMELGIGVDEAEAQAIASMGSPKAIAQSLVLVHESPKYPRAHTACLAIAAMASAASALLGVHELLDPHVRFIILGWLFTIPIVLVGYAAFRSPRLPWRGVLVMTPLVVLWAAMVYASAYIPLGYGGGIDLEYDDLEIMAAQHDQNARNATVRRAEIAMVKHRYLRGESIGFGSVRIDQPVKVVPLPSRAAADRVWKQKGDLNGWIRLAESETQEAARIRAIDRRFWWTGIPGFLWTGAQFALAFLLVHLVATLAGWSAGTVLRKLRQRLKGRNGGIPSA